MSKSGEEYVLAEMHNKLKVKSEQGAGSTKGPIPQLIFKQAQDLSKDEVYEICKAHGDIITVRECPKSGFKFVELASEATPRMSGKNLPRSYVQEGEHSCYPGTDSDEAAIVFSSESYIELPEETKNFTKKTEQYNAADQMSGTYSDLKEIQNLAFGTCAQCDRACNTICYRCSTYYCGKKCQREAWPEHRRVCGRPKSVARTVNNCKDYAEDLKPEHRNASSATNNYKENNPAKYAKSEAFTASRAANNFKTNGPVENTECEDRSTSQATNNYKEIGRGAATEKTRERNASWSANNYKKNGSEVGKSEYSSTAWAANNYETNSRAAAVKTKDRCFSLAGYDYKENGSVDGKSEDRSTSWAANNYKVNSPAASAINENRNASWGAKNYKGNGSEHGKIEDRSTSWAVNNYKADGRTAAPKNKERDGSWAANNYKTNGSEIDVKSDVLNTSSICFEALKERSQRADAPIQLTMPHSGSIVKITSICKLNVVFIRSKSYEVEVDFIKLLNHLDELARTNLRHLEEPPKCEQTVIVCFKERYSRALILDCNDLKYIKLIYIDYGIVDRINIRDIYECPNNLVLVPRFSNPVILKNVPDRLMTKETRTFMDSYVDNINMIIKYSEYELVNEKGTYLVELIDERTNQNFNKLILNICEHEESDNTCKDFKHDYLPVGDNIKLIVMDNSSLCLGCITCTTLESAFEIEKFQKLLQNYGDKLPRRAYTPSVGEVCIAKFCMDGQWYRGRCLEVGGNGCFKIIFIDYGNITTVHKNDVRLYPAQFKYPIYTYTCKIKGLPETCDKKLVQLLEQLIPANNIIQCDNVKVHIENKRTYNVITLSSMIKKLQDDGFIN